MSWIALRMLTGDRAKYFGLVFSIAFSSMLMAQQAGIFWGLMLRTASQIADVSEPDVWVMDPKTTNVDDSRPLKTTDVLRVRGVPGVAWAVPLYRNVVRLRVSSGHFRATLIMGLDDATLTGAPRRMLLGSLEALRRPQSIILDKAGYEYLWPGEPLELGRVVEVNDRRVTVNGIYDSSAPFITMPIAYAPMSELASIVPREVNPTSFVLAKAAAGQDPEAVAARISAATALKALTDRGFSLSTIRYYAGSTGIPVNFGITVALAFIVGAAIAGQTFYLFTLENLKQFGALKAMGVGNRRIIGMVTLQALVVGAIGFAIGMGLASMFFKYTSRITQLRGFYLPWPVAVGTGVAVLAIVIGTAMFSVRRVVVLEPATVFRG
jgi:putative ABC transport system permease protein